jgi:hypothetical protein
VKRDPRLEELLVQRALGGLTDAESEALHALGGADDDSYDRATAALELALAHDDAVPAGLRDKILAAAPRATLRPVSESTASGPAPASVAAAAASRGPRVGSTLGARRATWPAWLAAAASLAIAIGAWAWAASRPPVVIRETIPAPTIATSVASPVPSPPLPAAEARKHLLAEAADVRRVEWKPTKDPGGQGAGGDVVWSNAQQSGYVRFVGLAPNDAKQSQYQLWIFDKDRDAKYPVDGGVFDVGSSGEVVVAIAPKLHVDEPTLFAVTIERPGGVVVSKREHVVVVASPSG